MARALRTAQMLGLKEAIFSLEAAVHALLSGSIIQPLNGGNEQIVNN